jgi:hypothetical protein
VAGGFAGREGGVIYCIETHDSQRKCTVETKW